MRRPTGHATATPPPIAAAVRLLDGRELVAIVADCGLRAVSRLAARLPHNDSSRPSFFFPADKNRIRSHQPTFPDNQPGAGQPATPLPRHRPLPHLFGCVQQRRPRIAAIAADRDLRALARLAARLPRNDSWGPSVFFASGPAVGGRTNLNGALAAAAARGHFSTARGAATKAVARAAKHIPYSGTARRCGRHLAAIGRGGAALNGFMPVSDVIVSQTDGHFFGPEFGRIITLRLYLW